MRPDLPCGSQIGVCSVMVNDEFQFWHHMDGSQNNILVMLIVCNFIPDRE